MIYSPVNIDSEKLNKFEQKLKITSFLDPQLYLLNDPKGKLDTYPYFPGNLIPDFSTIDLEKKQFELAKLCVDFQLENNFEYIVIPTRHYDTNPTDFLFQCKEYFVDPFISYISSLKSSKKVLLSVIVKQIMLTDIEKFNEILNWVTGQLNIDGIYLIFENSFSTKQIKDFHYNQQALLNTFQHYRRGDCLFLIFLYILRDDLQSLLKYL